MTQGTGASAPKARYIAVQDVAYEPATGCGRTFKKPLLKTERLEIEQIQIRGRGDAEAHGDACSTDRAAYVLAGTAALTDEGRTQVGKGQLIVIPAGARWAEQLSVLSDELVLLTITRAGSSGAANDGAATKIRAVNPEQITAYEPAGHAKTQNRCLFIDGYMEIIEGKIDRGGGAERHFHRDNEQLLYVLSGANAPLLIHYPKCAPHGTGGGIAEPLDLLVVYSPPLGESQNALA